LTCDAGLVIVEKDVDRLSGAQQVLRLRDFAREAQRHGSPPADVSLSGLTRLSIPFDSPTNSVPVLTLTD
jgi:hypothetical protein